MHRGREEMPHGLVRRHVLRMLLCFLHGRCPMPKAKPSVAMNIVKLAEQFGSEERARTYLERLRWRDGVKCLRCGSDKISRIEERHQFDCDSCRYQFSVTAGTIFHDSHLPLFKWFMAVYLMCESRKGISANQMKRTLQVAYKTAWYLCHRIRAALKDADTTPLKGTVEVDESWVGGRRRHVGRGSRENKTMVLAAIQRGGQVRLKVDKRPDRTTLHAFIRKTTDPKTKAIMTDEWEAYKGIADEDTRHETVNHKAEEWVR